MSTTVKNDFQKSSYEQANEVRNLVLSGLEQIKTGNTKDFNAVCTRLEKKYKRDAISN